MGFGNLPADRLVNVKHRCEPPQKGPRISADIPIARDIRPGTVWRCDSCGTAWTADLDHTVLGILVVNVFHIVLLPLRLLGIFFGPVLWYRKKVFFAGWLVAWAAIIGFGWLNGITSGVW